jgi:hypothetical protein
MKHPWLWTVTLACAVVSLIVLVGGLYILKVAPDNISGQHLWSALKDIGPAIAGSWVLCAALLAITATGITSIVTLKDSESRVIGRVTAIRRVCVGEIKSFWDRCNELELHIKLTDHIAWMKSGIKDTDHSKTLDAFRRNVGDDWFSFFRVDPEALGELDEETSARYISLSVKVRHLTSRLNWLNGCQYDRHSLSFWIDYHNDTLKALNDLYRPSTEVLRLLGDAKTDPASFKFGI